MDDPAAAPRPDLDLLCTPGRPRGADPGDGDLAEQAAACFTWTDELLPR